MAPAPICTCQAAWPELKSPLGIRFLGPRLARFQSNAITAPLFHANSIVLRNPLHAFESAVSKRRNVTADLPASSLPA